MESRLASTSGLPLDLRKPQHSQILILLRIQEIGGLKRFDGLDEFYEFGLFIFDKICGFFDVIRCQILNKFQQETQLTMRNVHQPYIHPQKHRKTIHSSKHKTPSLKKIIQQVKFLQSCVSQIDASHSQTKPILGKQRKNRSQSRKQPFCTNRLSSSNKQSSKNENSLHQYSSIHTIRRPSKKKHQQSIQLNQQSRTFELNTIKYPPQTQIRANDKQQYFPMSFVSLQIENLMLQKQNLNLEKQLLEQELLMQRREKRLLRDKLKRIKTHNLADRMSSQSKKEQSEHITKTDIKQANYSPIKIKIPQFSLHHNSIEVIDNQAQAHNKTKREESSRFDALQNSKNDTIKTSKTFESIFSVKNLGEPLEEEDLLLSEQVRQQSSSKQNEGVLQKQFWTLLNQCEHQKSQKKWQMRQALGDIANRLKSLRKY